MHRSFYFVTISVFLTMFQCQPKDEDTNSDTDPNHATGSMMTCSKELKQFNLTPISAADAAPQMQVKQNGIELALKKSIDPETITLSSKEKLEGDFEVSFGYEDFKLAPSAQIQVLAISEEANRLAVVDIFGTKPEEASSEQIAVFENNPKKLLTLTQFGETKNPSAGRVHIKRQGTNLVVSVTHQEQTSVMLDLEKHRSFPDTEFGNKPVQLVLSLKGGKNVTDEMSSSIRLTDLQVTDGNGKLQSETFSCQN